MKIQTRFAHLSLIVFLMLGLSSCATTNQETSATSLDVSYMVKPGDRLSDIALKLTGDASNWTTIADHNGITNPRNLAVGQIILIPYKLFKQTYMIPEDIQNDHAGNNLPKTARAAAPLPVTTGNGLSVARGRDTYTGETVDINLIPVEVNRSFSLRPLTQPMFTQPTFSQADVDDADAQAPQIRVSGNYYPKGIYAEPANYARLVSRVSPGTMFKLESKVNDWYKILTDKGIGYIRQRDGTLVK